MEDDAENHLMPHSIINKGLSKYQVHQAQQNTQAKCGKKKPGRRWTEFQLVPKSKKTKNSFKQKKTSVSVSGWWIPPPLIIFSSPSLNLTLTIISFSPNPLMP